MGTVITIIALIAVAVVLGYDPDHCPRTYTGGDGKQHQCMRRKSRPHEVHVARRYENSGWASFVDYEWKTDKDGKLIEGRAWIGGVIAGAKFPRTTV